MTTNPLTPYGVPLDVLNGYLKSLYDADWEDARGDVRFDRDAKLDELGQADIFHNTRIFLNMLLDEGGTPTTATGNLNRAFVGRLFDRLRLDPAYRETIRRYCKAVNEPEVWPLHEIRLLAEYGKLVVRRNKRLKVTKLGRELLADERAGELFRRTFLTYFRTLDLCYLVPVRDQPEIQSAMAIILWRLQQVAENWRRVKGIAAQILPPRLLAHIVSQQLGEFATPDFFVSAYVLRPLQKYGMLERQRESEWQIGVEDRVRLTPLFRRFVRFAEIPSPMNN